MSETQTDAVQTEAPQDEAAFEGEFDAEKAKTLISALRAEKRKLQAKVKEAEPSLAELAKIKADSQTELERWQSFGKQNEERASAAERESLRLRVALDKGLPKNLAARLQGDDEAALNADADELLALIPADTSPRAPRPDISQGSSARPNGSTDPREQFAALMQGHLGR